MCAEWGLTSEKLVRLNRASRRAAAMLLQRMVGCMPAAHRSLCCTIRLLVAGSQHLQPHHRRQLLVWVGVRGDGC
jgi:hypothetical protein